MTSHLSFLLRIGKDLPCRARAQTILQSAWLANLAGLKRRQKSVSPQPAVVKRKAAGTNRSRDRKQLTAASFLVPIVISAAGILRRPGTEKAPLQL